MTHEPDIFEELIDNLNMHEMRVGQIGTVKGRLSVKNWGVHDMPAVLAITDADWTDVFVHLPDRAAHSAIPFALNAYVGVKVQCVDEDCTLVALAIWELPDGSPVIPLGAPTTIPKLSGTLTRSEP